MMLDENLLFQIVVLLYKTLYLRQELRLHVLQVLDLLNSYMYKRIDPINHA